MEPEFEISVVIPVYRVEAFLHDCVESVLVQTFREFEIVLVDDGSPDRCPAICDDYAARYADPTKGPVIRVVHKKNAGLGMARNTGMDAARGATSPSWTATTCCIRAPWSACMRSRYAQGHR